MGQESREGSVSEACSSDALILLLGIPSPRASSCMCRLTSGYTLAVASGAKHKSLLRDVRQGRDLPAL